MCKRAEHKGHTSKSKFRCIVTDLMADLLPHKGTQQKFVKQIQSVKAKFSLAKPTTPILISILGAIELGVGWLEGGGGLGRERGR